MVLNQARDVFMAWYLVKHKNKFILPEVMSSLSGRNCNEV